MADPITLYNSCGKCHGDGQFPNAYIDFYGNIIEPEDTVDCPDCGGTGKQAYGLIPASYQEQIDDIQDKINDTFDKCNGVFEKVNELEDYLIAIDANVKSNIETCDKILKLVEK